MALLRKVFLDFRPSPCTNSSGVFGKVAHFGVPYKFAKAPLRNSQILSTSIFWRQNPLLHRFVHWLACSVVRFTKLLDCLSYRRFALACSAASSSFHSRRYRDSGVSLAPSANDNRLLSRLHIHPLVQMYRAESFEAPGRRLLACLCETLNTVRRAFYSRWQLKATTKYPSIAYFTSPDLNSPSSDTNDT